MISGKKYAGATVNKLSFEFVYTKYTWASLWLWNNKNILAEQLYSVGPLMQSLMFLSSCVCSCSFSVLHLAFTTTGFGPFESNLSLFIQCKHSNHSLLMYAHQNNRIETDRKRWATLVQSWWESKSYQNRTKSYASHVLGPLDYTVCRLNQHAVGTQP